LPLVSLLNISVEDEHPESASGKVVLSKCVQQDVPNNPERGEIFVDRKGPRRH